MIVRLALAVALALTATGPTALAEGRAPASRPTTTAASLASAAIGAVRTEQVTPPSDEVTVTEVEVVVPPVEPDGEVVETPDVERAQQDQDVIVTDQVEGDRVESDVVETGEFQTVGVTWPMDAAVGELGTEVRTRAQGVWSEWVPLPTTDDAPDAGSPDSVNAVRAGTDPLWVGDADAVQLSFAATAEGGPQDMSLALIGSEEATVATSDAVVGATAQQDAILPASFVAAVAEPGTSTDVAAADPAVATAPLATAVAPTVISRSDWGARPQSCSPDVASKLVGAVVHHTAGSNTYTTVAQAMQQIRNDQTYHMDGRGWCDLGYNFVVDKWGNIYEGRADSLTSAVIGVHAGGFNTGTVGVSMLGNYDQVGAPPVMIDAVGRIVGSRLAVYGIDPQGTMSYYTGVGDNGRYKNQTVSLPRVFGHRDVSYTACPGVNGYAQMPTIRNVARAYYDARQFAEAQAVVKALYQDLLGRGPDPTGLNGWTAALMQGTSQSALVSTLTRSDEYISLRVTKAYREVLGREPEAAGALAWFYAIRNGERTVDDVQRRFYDSTEYFKASGGTNEGYVQRLYTTMTRRAATAAEVTNAITLMGQNGRGWVVDSLWFSREAASVRAGDYYMTFLGRAPDAPGQAAWAEVLLVHGEGAVRAGIAGSIEYRQRALSRFLD